MVRVPLRIVVGLAWLVPAARPQVTLAPEVVNLVRIKQGMRRELERVVNITCLEVIDRSRVTRSGAVRRTDTIRLEVALVEGKELFAWPGSERFDERPLESMIGSGAVSTGAFGILARTVFASIWPAFRYVGEESLDGRRALRYDYEVPSNARGYRVTIDKRQATVGFRGSFWADAQTLDVLRLTAEALDIPIEIGLSGSQETIDYARVPIGEERILLPQQAESVLTFWSGERSRNVTQFTGWLQYRGESRLLTEVSPEVVASPAAPTRTIELPAGLVVAARLETAIDSDKAAVGDLLVARIERPVERNGQTLVPAGARLTGRLRWLQRISDSTSLIALDFTELNFEGAKARVTATLEALADPSGRVRRFTGGVREARIPKARGTIYETSEIKVPDILGVSWITVAAAHFRIAPGLRMTWKAIQPPMDADSRR